MDLLSLLEDDTDPPNVDNSLVVSHLDVAVAADQPLPLQPVQQIDESLQLESLEERNCRIPSMAGKVGQGRHGGEHEKGLLALHMRHAKMLRKNHNFRHIMADLLQDSCFMKNGVPIQTLARVTASGVILCMQKASTKGNQYKRVIPWITFLQVAYGKLNHSSHIAMSLNVSQRSVGFMTTLVGQIFMNQQMVVLAKLIALASKGGVRAFIKQIKWDESQLLCSVNADKSDSRILSTWQTMAVRQKLMLVLPNGTSLVLRLVTPPIALLASGAHHIYYGLRHHPVYQGLNRLLDLLAGMCEHKVCIWESDGAYSNERLMAHVLHKNQSDEVQFLNIPCRCQNHATQLTNVSLLSCVGQNLLNRLYGMTVFLRNLGYWLRMRQSLLDWLSETLDFRQEIFSPDLKGHVQHSAVLMELIDFIWSSRNMESSEGHKSFERKVEALLDMWNTDTSNGTPGHVCSHAALASGERHCLDRSDAVRKCAKSFLDLFMVLPSVPTPNKWTTMNGSIDFLLSGIVIHKWLPQIFRRAFRDFKFSEFTETMATVDPKLVESLSFHAVNGRRHDSTLEFLHSDASMCGDWCCLQWRWKQPEH